MNGTEARAARWMVMGRRRPWLTVDEIASRSKLPRAKVRSLVHSMSRAGLVERGADGYTGPTYRLTPEGVSALSERRRQRAQRLTPVPGSSTEAWQDRHVDPQHASRVTTTRPGRAAVRQMIRGEQ